MKSNDHDYNAWLSTHMHDTPTLSFPPHWNVQLMPSFGGALTRFLVDEHVSVYFDIDNSLGHMRGPYWEIYPTEYDETERFMVGEEEQMIAAINRILDY